MEERGFLDSWLGGWRRAVELKVVRLASAHVAFDQGVESDLFLMAVRNLVRACEAFQDDHRVRKALDAFSTAAPDVTQARDLLEHFDVYDRGIGRLQKAGPMQESSLLVFDEDTGSEQLIHIGPHVINVTRTYEAADELAEGVMTIATSNPAQASS